MIIGNYTRTQLIELGHKLLSSESDQLYELFSQQFNHPCAANLFFYPENYNARTDNLTDYDPSVEEVVDKAIAYEAIRL